MFHINWSHHVWGQAMKIKLLLLISTIFSYSAFAADLPTGHSATSWKIKNDGVNPYNTSRIQTDYVNENQWSVAGTRDVKKDGSSYKQTVVAKVETTSKEIKDTIANRAKNLAKHTKGLGKATAGGFLGSLALTGLMEGIGWVMDEGGKVTKSPEQPNFPTNYLYRFYAGTFSQPEDGIRALAKQGFIDGSHEISNINCRPISNLKVYCTFIVVSLSRESAFDFDVIPNPNYDPNATPQREVLTQDQIADGVREALESNNPALGAAIAAAVKEAFQDSQLDRDPDTGEIYAPIPKKTQQALDDAGNEALEKEDNPTVCVPNVGDLEGNCTYMPKKEADKIPTLKCEMHPTQSANHCVYVADPDAPPKSTIDKPQIGEDGALPDSCKWFDFLCVFTDWMQDDDFEETETEPEITDLTPPDVNTNLLNVAGSCPADFVYQMNFFGHTGEIRWSYSYACDFFGSLSPWVKLLCAFASLKIIRGRSNG